MKAFNHGVSGAVFSDDDQYRYSLWRYWGSPSASWCCFCMLNPSTADDIANDPTIERCERRARMWGYSGLIAVNLFAFRSSDRKILKTVKDPVGPYNDAAIDEAVRRSEIVICAWGRDGGYRGRAEFVKAFILGRNASKIHYLKMGKEHPWHPLYLSYSLTPVPWSIGRPVGVAHESA